MAVGGELEEMAQLSRTFADNATSATTIRTTVNNVLTTTTWTGPAADRFRDAWNQFAPSLDQLSQALSDAGQEVQRRREALDNATR
ncbi:MAG: WXG100 family type VII secretion target [Corynebacteriales bacterium]|nr:WXG100 family type VII secretion target [Mycobacteriales bacterium]